MNILHLSTYRLFPPQTGGQKGIVFFSEALSLQTKVVLVSTLDNKKSSDFHFELIPFFSTNFWIKYLNIFYVFNLFKIIKKKNISTIIFEQPYLPFIFILLRVFTKCQCVYYSRNIEYKRFRSYQKKVWLVLYLIEKIYIQWSHKVFFVSEDDKNFIESQFHFNKEKIFYLPHILEISQIPLDQKYCKDYLRQLYSIQAHETLLFFNGSLSYEPNFKALEKIVNDILPLLKKEKFPFKIIICGGHLPKKFNEFKDIDEIIYAAFVEDISLYNKGVDVFINPVIEGGGVKVKLLEALSYNVYCVSTESGAKGVTTSVCGNQLKIVADNDWQSFVKEILEFANHPQENIPQHFYDLYALENVGKRAYEVLKG